MIVPTATHWATQCVAVGTLIEICPGFGAPSALKKGENYSYTFNKVGECRYFNQLKPSQKGAIDARKAE